MFVEAGNLSPRDWRDKIAAVPTCSLSSLFPNFSYFDICIRSENPQDASLIGTLTEMGGTGHVPWKSSLRQVVVLDGKWERARGSESRGTWGKRGEIISRGPHYGRLTLLLPLLGNVLIGIS